MVGLDARNGFDSAGRPVGSVDRADPVTGPEIPAVVRVLCRLVDCVVATTVVRAGDCCPDEPRDEPGCEPEVRPVPKLEVEVWLGRVATAADDLTPLDLLTRLDGRTGPEIVRAVSRRARAEFGLARTGQCPDCAGPTTVRLAGEAHDVEISCESCRWLVEVGYLLPLLSDAGVVSALTDIGLPVVLSYY